MVKDDLGSVGSRRNSRRALAKAQKLEKRQHFSG